MEDYDTTFSKLSDDVILKIFTLLEDDPRNWARLSSVSTKFHSLISSTCYKSKCIASLSSDLLSLSSSDGWPSLFKLSVCCPGLLHSGVLLDNSDFGLHRELGVDVHSSDDFTAFSSSSSSSSSSQIHHLDDRNNNSNNNHADADDGGNNNNNNSNLFEGWSLYDDLYLDTIYDNSESCATPMAELTAGVVNLDTEFVASNNRNDDGDDSENDSKRRKVVSDNDSGNDEGGGEVVARRSHLASGAWNLSREQGMKLLASRFRGDCLYISDWPGCVHGEDKRKYMLFRGVFSDFKRTRVWRTIKDGNHRSKTELNCAFCRCNETWDLHSAFCLKRGFGFHDDGEPVVRAYVCENGHVSGAWTDFPLFT